MSDTFAIGKDGTDACSRRKWRTHNNTTNTAPSRTFQFISCSFKKLLSIDVSLIRISLIYD